MDDLQQNWWHREFRPAEDREGTDFVSRDAKTVVDVQLSPHGMRGVYAGLMSLGLLLARKPLVDRACLIIDATRLSRERLMREWRNLQEVFTPGIAKRLSLVAVGKDETLIEPEDNYLRQMATAFKAARSFEIVGRVPDKTPGIFGRQTFLEVAKVLLIRWLLREGPIAVGKLAQTVGCTYPTIRAVLRRLDSKQYIKRYSNRNVELARFPDDTWSEMIALSSPMRRSVQFVDVSGQKPDPYFLLKRLERLRPSGVAIGGVVAAALWHTEFDLRGLPRLDLIVHSPDGATDLGFVAQLDPALKAIESMNESPVIVAHSLLRNKPLFKTRQEGQMPIADPIETTLDLVEMGLTVQADQMLQHFRKEIRIS